MSDDNTQLPDDGSPPGHIEKMLGRKPDDQNDDSQGGDDQVAQRPDNVPEKFWDAEKGAINTEALLKAQADAEAALRGQQQAPADDKEGNDDSNEGNSDDEVTPNQTNVVADASKEWDEKGELSEATLKSLEGVGLSREMVSAYIQGQEAVIGNLQSAAYEPFEGKDGYEEAANWASQNLDENEIKALDVQLTSNNPAIVKQGAKALARRFAEEGDREPGTIRGNANSSTHGDSYKSRREMMKDMSSPRYRTDEGFRQEVKEKLRRSNL
jgi:hypothetical protein